MRTGILILALSLCVASCSRSTYYVVRHAEKEAATTMSTDVPLSAAGQARAAALRDQLRNEGVRHIYSTNTQRTRATARPLSEAIGQEIQLYDPRDTSFPARIKSLPAGNVLIVGHSNTVDDLVNRLSGQHLLTDLPETQYGDLFIVQKKGKRYVLSRKSF